MLKLIYFGYLLVLVTCHEERKEFQIPIDKELVLESPYYPDTTPEPTTSLIWSLTSPDGTRVSVECDDLRISPTNNCEKGYLILSHSQGQTEPQCGSASGLNVTSSDNRISLHFELIWAAGLCRAKAIMNPTSTVGATDSSNNAKRIHLQPGKVLYQAIQMKPIPESSNLKYDFVTEPGYRIGIKCPSLWMTKNDREEKCNNGRFLFDVGERQLEICNNSNNLVLVSSTEELTVTIESTRHTIGFIECTVLTTTGKHFEQYKNEPELPDVDSSEHGHPLKRGPKNTTCDCGWANKPARRILNGLDVSPHEFPWMAGLLPHGESRYTFCGGTIVTRRHVISAAHCTTKIPATHVVVGMDHLSRRDGGQVIPVEKTVNHEYKQGYASSKDICILILAEDIKFGALVGPACLPTHDPNLVNQPVIAIGWGGMTSDEFKSGRDEYQLKKAKLRVIGMDSCNPVWDGRWPTDPQIHVCTWHKNRDVCFGDSGGPVVWLDPETNRYTLIGIPSACDGCKLEKPALHTALHYYYSWILETIHSNNHGDLGVCTKID